MKKYISLLAGLICYTLSNAQLTIETGASFTLQSAAKVIVEGNVSSNADIEGSGTLVMKGAVLQNLHMNGSAIPNLEIDNISNVAMQSSVTINSNLIFTNGRIHAGAYDLTLGNVAAVSGYGPSAFVVTNGAGRLVQQVAGTSKLFPVGADNNSYTPAMLTNTGVADDFYVRVAPGVYSNGTSGALLSEKAVNRTWYISESVNGGSNATLNLQWNIANELPGFTAAQVFLSHYHNGQWDPGVANIVSYVAGIGGVSRSGITGFSPFSIGSIGSLIPVTLLDFSAGILNSTVVTRWSTSFEQNNSHFEIERSSDGVHFSPIGSVNAYGNSNVTRHYSFPDMQPRPSVNFYRLRIVDINGQGTYSKTVAVRFGGSNVFQVFPNPVKDVVYIQADGQGAAVLYITDAAGRKIKEEKVLLSGVTSFSADVSKLAAGVYNLVLIINERKEHQQFIKE